MKRPEPDSQIPLPKHDYGLALQNAVSWLGDRYVLAEPQTRRSDARPVYVLEPQQPRRAVKLRGPTTRH
jgi:hypothetical protein